MNFAAVSHTRERTGEGWATALPVHLFETATSEIGLIRSPRRPRSSLNVAKLGGGPVPPSFISEREKRETA